MDRGSGHPVLVLRGLVKRYGDVAAVDGVDLAVDEGEFITLLGPSGSGKTTTLRMIAGFIAQTSGMIEIGGVEASRIPPYRRDVGMVFQNYALFPHLTAAQNIAFPLEMRHSAKAEIKRRVAEALALVKLENHGERYPRQLSGGQQQRVALARAVVFQPRLLLMDEPLGALDKKLREALQLEIMHISRRLHATVIYVTHDQEEALVMSDRIAIFNQGRIEQLGSGEDLYERPSSLFVAGFIGESNIFRGRLEIRGDTASVVTSDFCCRVSTEAVRSTGLSDGASVAVLVRPERLSIEPEASAPTMSERTDVNSVTGTLDEIIYVGPIRRYALTLGNGVPVVVRREGARTEPDLRLGEAATISWRIGDGVLLSGDGA